jgi:predicted nucleic acid-binding protein
MIVLDTNVISETSKPRPDSRLVSWLSAQKSENVFWTCVTVMEIAYGGENISSKPARSDISIGCLS